MLKDFGLIGAQYSSIAEGEYALSIEREKAVSWDATFDEALLYVVEQDEHGDWYPVENEHDELSAAPSQPQGMSM